MSDKLLPADVQRDLAYTYRVLAPQCRMYGCSKLADLCHDLADVHRALAREMDKVERAESLANLFSRNGVKE